MEPLTESEIEAGRTKKGGFSKDQLAKWGVSWPPSKGWKAKLLAGEDVGENETSDRVSFTLTSDRAFLLKAASDMSAIDRNHYALIMLGKMIDRGEFLAPDDWWRGTPEGLAAHKAEYPIMDSIG